MGARDGPSKEGEMPKEVIYGDLPQGEDGPGVSVVEVRWDRETGYFQIVTKALDRITGGELVEPEPESGIHYTAGFYVGLDRREINSLIRVLRRARDQAYGRDE